MAAYSLLPKSSIVRRRNLISGQKKSGREISINLLWISGTKKLPITQKISEKVLKNSEKFIWFVDLYLEDKEN